MSSEEWDDEDDEEEFDSTLEVVRLKRREVCVWCGHYIKSGATCWEHDFQHEGVLCTNYEHFVCHERANRPDRFFHGMLRSYAEEAELLECHEPWEFWENELGLPLIDLDRVP
jgi:hypothetical protein